MKQARHFFTTFLSAYLLILMVLPCNDAHAQSGTILETQFAQLQNDQHHEDFCTPFCICSCCTTPIILAQAAIIFEVSYFENYQSQTTSFYKSITSAFFGSIWQPPQLV